MQTFLQLFSLFLIVAVGPLVIVVRVVNSIN